MVYFHNDEQRTSHVSVLQRSLAVNPIPSSAQYIDHSHRELIPIDLAHSTASYCPGFPLIFLIKWGFFETVFKINNFPRRMGNANRDPCCQVANETDVGRGGRWWFSLW